MNFNYSDILLVVPIIIMFIIIIKLLFSMHENKKYWEDIKNGVDEDLNLNNLKDEIETDTNLDERVKELLNKAKEDPNFDFEKAFLQSLEQLENQEVSNDITSEETSE